MPPSGLPKHSLSPEQVLDGLGAIALSISQTQSLDYILNTAAQKVRELLQTDRVIIFRFQADGSGLVVQESVAAEFPAILNQNIHDPCFKIHWAEIYRLGGISAIADIYTSNIQPCHLNLLAQYQVRANLIVPILQHTPNSESEIQHHICSLTKRKTKENCSASKTQNKLWGLLIAHQCSGTRQWQQLEQKLLQQLAVLIGVAIQQAEAFEQFHTELALRKQAESSLKELLQELELRVETRTKELSQVNDQLRQEIAERQRVETRNTLLATAVEHAGDAIYVSDFDGNLEYANPAAEKITGYTQAEVLGKTPASLFRSGHHSAEFYQAMFDTIASGQVWRGNLIAKRKDGSLCYQEATISPVRDRTGMFTHVVAVKRDVTLALDSQKALQESEERLRLALDAASMGTWDWNLVTGKITWSANHEAHFGFVPGTFDGTYEAFLSCIHPEDREFVIESLNRTLNYGENYDIEFRIIVVEGSIRWAGSKGQVFYNEIGQPVRMAGIDLDITQRKRTEAALQKSEKRFRQIFQEASFSIAVADFHTHQFVHVNPAFYQLLGYSPSEMISLSFDEITHPEDLPQDLHYLEQINQDQRDSYRMEKRYFKKNGEVVWVKMAVTMLRDEDGNPEFSLALIEDITERRQLQTELMRSEERFRTSLENMLDCFGIYTSIRDSNGKIVDFVIEYINQAACVNNHLTKDEQFGKSLCEILPVHTKVGLFEAYCKVVETGQPLVKESVVYADIYNDEHLYRVVDLQVVKLGDGVAVAWRDVTERQQVQEQIQASLQEKETLIKEIHHRVKNNLQVISSLLRLQSRQIKDRQALELFKESQNRVLAMALIHEKLYQSSDLTQIDFQAYIKSLVQELCRSYDVCKSTVTFKVKVNQKGTDADDSSILGQKTYCSQSPLLAIDTAIPCGLIINELVSNSLKYAFPDNRSGEICITFQESEHKHFLLSISDNGIGLPSNLDFRNTKSLGLQLVCRLTKQLEATIELSRHPGTEFKIAFAELK